MTGPISEPGEAAESLDEAPVVRILRGDPTPEELAALLAVVGSLRSPAPVAEGGPASTWHDPAQLMRRTVAPGPHAWRFSYMPR